MNSEKLYPSVSDVTFRLICKLENSKNKSEIKSILATFRNSLGKDLSQVSEIWSIIFESMPDEFLGTNSKITAEERVILNTLQLYALYQQGNFQSMLSETDVEHRKNFGGSLSVLRIGDQRLSADRRFNSMITSTTYEEFLFHLRQMMSLLKSKSKGTVKVDFAKLSNDLFLFCIGKEDLIRISWGREYYRNKKQANIENESEGN